MNMPILVPPGASDDLVSKLSGLGFAVETDPGSGDLGVPPEPADENWDEWWRASALSPRMRLAPQGHPAAPEVWEQRWPVICDALLLHRRFFPYLAASAAASGLQFATAEPVDGGWSLGDRLIVAHPGTGTVDVPAGTWVRFEGVERVRGPATVPVEGGPQVAFQREGSVVPTWGPRRHEPELVLHVAVGGSDAFDLPDGTQLRLEPDRLLVTGPERDLVVLADGVPVLKARTDDLDADLRYAVAVREKLLALGTGEPGWLGWMDFAEVRRAAEAEAARGVHHYYDIEPAAPGPEDQTTVRITTDTELTAAWVYATDDGSEPGGHRGVAERGYEVAMEPDAEQRYRARLPARPAGTVVRYRIETVQGGAGRYVDDAAPDYSFPTPNVGFTRPSRSAYAYRVTDRPAPGWVRDAVVYHLLVDRFATGSPEPLLPPEELGFLAFAGGRLQGVIDRLDHIADLGANTLWLAPIFRADMNVCYDVRDLFDVDPRLGSLDDVRALCGEAHRRGMRVILDFEPSYLGSQHPFVLEARHDPASPYRAWFHHDDAGLPYGWFSSPILIALDHDHAEVRDHMLAAARFWLEQGFDGFRLDSAHAASLEFWAHFGQAVRDTNPDAFTIVEATRPLDECLRYRGRVDGFLDFDVCGALRAFAGAGTCKASDLDWVLSSRAELPDGFVPGTFFENHDMDRFTATAGGDPRRLRLAHLLLLSAPGVPILYYGTEIGLSQAEPGALGSLSRMPMLWGAQQDTRLFDDVRALVRMRRDTAALRSGSHRTLHVDDDAATYAFARELDDQRVIVVVNGSDAARTVSLEADTGPLERISPGFGTSEVTTVDGRIQIGLDAFGGCVLLRTGDAGHAPIR